MPLFIVGFARSGTTLCQQLVSQRLVLPTLPETHFFEFLERYEPAGGQITSAAARDLLDDLSRFVDLPDPRFPQLLAEPHVPIRALFLRLVGQQIGSQALAAQGLWLEKTPGHADHLERIHQLFPKAKFICMVRNPLGAFASRRELMAPGKGWGEEWKPIEAFCASWADHVRQVRAFDERHPGLLMTLRLEDLAADPESQLSRVHDFVGPAYASGTTAPVQRAIVQPFETWKRDALQPADPKIAGREGKAGLDAYEAWRVKTLLHDEMASFGYDAEAEEPALDDLHRRLVASLDWYRDAMTRRDALMDVKTARIRGLLNDLADEGRPAMRRRRGRGPGGAGAGAGAQGDAEAPQDTVDDAVSSNPEGDAVVPDDAGDAPVNGATGSNDGDREPAADRPQRQRRGPGAPTAGTAPPRPRRVGPKPEADE
jgi:hypothetical protein